MELGSDEHPWDGRQVGGIETGPAYACSIVVLVLL